MTSYLKLKNGGRIAYNKTEGETPGIMFCGGFRSDMSGVKATALENFCKKQGRAYLRFDYEGHGLSSGDFADGTIGKWKDNALTALTKLTEGRQILVGSSMGGWISLLLAKQKPRRVAGVVGIAAAPDFTEVIMERLKKNQIKEMMSKGRVMVTSDSGDHYPITRKFIEEARSHLLLNHKEISVTCPVRLIHGTKDEEVPWEVALQINERLASDDVKTILVENGNHTLSQQKDIKKILNVVDKMVHWLRA